MMKKEQKAKNSFIDKLNQFNLGRCAACGKFKLKSLFVRSEKSQMPTAPENFKTAIPTNMEFWADNEEELAERFNAWLSS